MGKKNLWISFGAFLTFFLIWELFARLFKELLFVLPPPSAIFRTLWESRARLAFHTQVTLKEMLGGFFLALSIAFPLAWTMLRFQASRAVLQPFFIVIQCLPMFTLAPIMVIWFGWSYTAIVVPTALMIFFPLTLNIYQGLRATPQEYLDFFQLNQATFWQTFFKLRLPSALPHIFAGFRISAAIAGIGAVGGEWAGAQNGLGILMLESRRNTDLEMTFSALFCLTFLSTFLYGWVLLCENLFLFPNKEKKQNLAKAKKLVLSRKRRTAFVCIGFALLSLGIIGCAPVEKKSTRLLLDWLPNPNHVPLYVALEKGFFEEENLSIELQKMHENGGGISYLTSGQADLLISHMPSLLRASARGADLKIVGTLIKEPLNGLIYLKECGKEIRKPQDLSGCILGYCVSGPDTSFLNDLLERGDIKPKEKRNVSVDLVAAMGTKSVHFIYGGFWNIEPAQLRSLGIETGFFKLGEFDIPSYYEMLIIGNRETPETEPAFLLAFQKALQKSIDFCKCFPDEAFDCYLKHNPDKREKTLAWEREAWKITVPLLAEDQSIDSEILSNFYRWMKAHLLFDRDFDYTKIYGS